MEVLISHLKRFMTRDQLQLLLEHGTPLTGPQGLRKWVAERSLQAFADLYFSPSDWAPSGNIHLRMYASLQQVIDRARAGKPGLKLARALPRGVGKSTIHARYLPLHGMLFGWSPLTILLGNTQQASERLLLNIREELETNDAIINDFGLVRGDVWTQNHIETSTGAARAFGVGNGALRGVARPGQRPSLIIGDDLDDDQSARSAIELQSNTEWWDKAVMSLGDQVAQTTSYVVVGTIIRSTSLMQHVLDSADFHSIVERAVVKFSDNPELWQQWRDWYVSESKEGRRPDDPASDGWYQSNKTALLEGTEVLWPRKDAYYHSMLFKLSRGDQAFFSELQNQPGLGGGNLGPIPRITLPTALSEWELLGSLDPTIKGGKRADRAAWIEAFFHRVKKEVVFSYCNAEQRPAGQTVDFVINRLRKSTRRYSGLWVEANASGTLVADSIDQKIAYLNYNIVQIHNSAPKEDRIGALSIYAARQQVYVADDINPAFVAEWEGFGAGHRFDDCLDAAATIVLQLQKLGLLDLV
jgi:hypothetical protein